MSTNPVESMIEIVRNHARNVKRWQPGDMRLRWAAAGMLEAANQFRRIKGYSQLPQLAAALKKATSTTEDWFESTDVVYERVNAFPPGR
jgi:putative transposase